MENYCDIDRFCDAICQTAQKKCVFYLGRRGLCEHWDNHSCKCWQAQMIAEI